MNSISIYIPRVGADCDEAFFRQFFHMLCFGDVERVDFVALDYDYTSNGRFRKAFVHFQFVYNTNIADDIVTTLSRGEPYRLYPRAGEHWILLKNKVPVLATTMNIHQLAENHRLLEEKTQLLEEKTQLLEEKSRRLEDLLEEKEEKARGLEDSMLYLEEKMQFFEEAVVQNDEVKSRALEGKNRALQEKVKGLAEGLNRTQQVIFQMISKLNMPMRDVLAYERLLMNVDEGFPTSSKGPYDMMPLHVLERQYGKLTYNPKTGGFADCDGFVRYVAPPDDELEEQEDKEQDDKEQEDKEQEDKEQDDKEQEDKEEDDDFDFLGEDIEDSMMSFCMLEKKYGPLTFNNKTNDFTDGDGFVRYVLSKTEMLDEKNEQEEDLFGTGPFLKYADFCRLRKERNEREENNLKMD